MNWEIALAFITALGGIEGVKYFANRKANSRIVEVEAEAAEFHILQETTEFLQGQLKQKEERFAEQTLVVRKLNSDIIALEREVGRLNIELAKKRCDDDECPFRQPPNANTPPRPGLTREQYHASKVRKPRKGGGSEQPSETPQP